MKNVVFVLFLMILCGCSDDNKEDKTQIDLFEEPVTEWGISMEVLKSKVKYPVFEEWVENNTLSVTFNDVKLIGNNPGYIGYHDISREIEEIQYFFINDNTTLNAVKCTFGDSIDYFDLVLDLRLKYGIEKSNTDKFISWQTTDTYVSLNKPGKESCSLYYIDVDLLDTKPVPVTDVSIIGEKEYTLFIRDLIVLDWQITPSNGANDIDIISTNTNVAEVLSQDGKILAKSRGNAQIILRVKGTNIADTCNIVVTGLSGTIFNFENVDQTGKYHIFYEINGTGRFLDWASGNPGYSMTGQADSPAKYPTCSSADGKSGKCLKLETLSTGQFGEKLGMPIAAGNLFMGNFDTGSALSNSLKATQFGLPFENVPTYLTGYYKFKAGSEFQEFGNTVLGKKDQCDIYALFYETNDKLTTLDGTNAFTHPNLVSVARIDNQKETDEWTQFYLPFITKPGKSVDKDKLKAGKYNVAIVFSSSLEGDRFNGAVGSTLYIDEVELICAPD